MSDRVIVVSEEMAAQISTALSSADPGRVKAALRRLGEAATDGTEISVRAPELADLEKLESVPEDLLLLFLNALWKYPFFDPEISLDEIDVRSLDAVLTYGGHYSAFLFSLHLQTSPLPDLAVRLVIDTLARRALSEGSSACRIAQYLVDFLLDSMTTRESVVYALAGARRENLLEHLVDYFRPAFSESELARIEGA